VPRSPVVSPQERTDRTVSAKVFPSPGLINMAGGFFTTLFSLAVALEAGGQGSGALDFLVLLGLLATLAQVSAASVSRAVSSSVSVKRARF